MLRSPRGFYYDVGKVRNSAVGRSLQLCEGPLRSPFSHLDWPWSLRGGGRRGACSYNSLSASPAESEHPPHHLPNKGQGWEEGTPGGGLNPLRDSCGNRSADTVEDWDQAPSTCKPTGTGLTYLLSLLGFQAALQGDVGQLSQALAQMSRVSGVRSPLCQEPGIPDTSRGNCSPSTRPAWEASGSGQAQ